MHVPGLPARLLLLGALLAPISSETCPSGVWVVIDEPAQNAEMLLPDPDAQKDVTIEPQIKFRVLGLSGDACCDLVAHATLVSLENSSPYVGLWRIPGDPPTWFRKEMSAGGFFLSGPWPGEPGHVTAGRDLARVIGTIVGRGNSVLDLGAGSGQYGYCFNRSDCAADLEVDWQGFDGAVNVEDYTEQARQHEVPELPTVKHANLADAADLPVADWVMSLEVGEHLPEEFTAEFLKNIHRNNRRGVVISWALAHPWARGQGHINNRDNDEVVCLFEQLGYEFDREWSARGRNASLVVNSWFADTFMVFRRRQPPLHPSSLPPPPTDLELHEAVEDALLQCFRQYRYTQVWSSETLRLCNNASGTVRLRNSQDTEDWGTGRNELEIHLYDAGHSHRGLRWLASARSLVDIQFEYES
jgi:hypothetical protein